MSDNDNRNNTSAAPVRSAEERARILNATRRSIAASSAGRQPVQQKNRGTERQSSARGSARAAERRPARRPVQTKKTPEEITDGVPKTENSSRRVFEIEFNSGSQTPGDFPFDTSRPAVAVKEQTRDEKKPEPREQAKTAYVRKTVQTGNKTAAGKKKVIGIKPISVNAESIKSAAKNIAGKINPREIHHEKQKKRVTIDEKQRRTMSPRERMKFSSESRRKERLRSDRIIKAAVAFAVVAAVVVVVSLIVTAYFKIDTIETQAIGKYLPDEIIAACGLENGDSLLTAREKKISEAVSSALPYIDSVEVKKKYPGTVILIPAYETVAYSASYLGGYVYLDDTGKVLETGAEYPSQDAVLLTGGSIAEAVPGRTVVFEDASFLQKVTDLDSELRRNGYVNVSDINFTPLAYSLAPGEGIIGYTVTVVIDGRITADFGIYENVSQRLAFGWRVIADNYYPGETQIINVDLTESKHAIVSFGEEQENDSGVPGEITDESDENENAGTSDGEDNNADGDEIPNSSNLTPAEPNTAVTGA